MKYYLVFTSLLIWSLAANAQSLERSAIVTGGDFLLNGSSLSQTIGEPIGDFFFNETTHLTQGFQQGVLDIVILPIELLDFAATRLNREEVQINWRIEDFKALESIVLERKIDNKSAFAPIANWSFEDKNEWSYLDKNNFIEHSYYRLKMISLDGQIQYSTLEEVAGVPLVNKVKVSPNPFVNIINIEVNSDERLANEPITIAVFDNVGKLIQQYDFENTTQQILALSNLGALESGTYQLVISIATFTQTISIIKS